MSPIPPTFPTEEIFSPVASTGFALSLSGNTTITVGMLDAYGNLTVAPSGGQVFNAVTTVNSTITPSTLTIPAGSPTGVFQITSTIASTYTVTVTPGAGPLSGSAAQSAYVSIDPDSLLQTTSQVNGATRPYYRDAIRRKMGFTPPADNKPNGIIGDNPAGESWPTNIMINQAISDAIRKINSTVQFFVQTSMEITVPVQSTNGYQWVPLIGVGGQSMQNSMNAILRAIWVDSIGNDTVLMPKDFRFFDRQYTSGIDNYSPSVPRWFITQGYQIGLLPASSTGGTLTLWGNTSLPDFSSDIDTLPQLPIDYAACIEDLAVVYCNQTNTSRPESANQIKIYQQRATEGLAAIAKYKSSLTQLEQPNLIYNSQRRQRWV